MPDIAKMKRHASLVDAAAARLGIDLEEQALSGALRFDEISDAVLKCMSCTNPDDCAHWLSRNEPVAESPPVYCRNKSLMRRLKEVPA